MCINQIGSLVDLLCLDKVKVVVVLVNLGSEVVVHHLHLVVNVSWISSVSAFNFWRAVLVSRSEASLLSSWCRLHQWLLIDLVLPRIRKRVEYLILLVVH
jgi:hypothetical protein